MSYVFLMEEEVREKDTKVIVDSIRHGILSRPDFERPHHIILYGGNGSTKPVARSLQERLGWAYDVQRVEERVELSGEIPFNVHYVDMDWAERNYIKKN